MADSIHVRFIRNVSWGGTEYGPSYPRKETEIEAPHARALIARGVCVECEPSRPRVRPPADDETSVKAKKKTADPPARRTRAKTTRTRKKADG
jgi:hypothetical protein